MKSFFEAFNDEIESELNDVMDSAVDSEYTRLNEAAKKVMESYLNANKWLDIIKEYLFTELSCVFFSSYIHNLAHTMPVRFDKFGDILHTINMSIPYPATDYIPEEPLSIDGSFSLIFMILDAIKDSLNTFIKCADENYHGMACSAEALLNDIESEYTPLYKMQKNWNTCSGDIVQFDKWVNQYVCNRDKLSESFQTRRLTESKYKDVAKALGVSVLTPSQVEYLRKGWNAYFNDPKKYSIWSSIVKKCMIEDGVMEPEDNSPDLVDEEPEERYTLADLGNNWW